MSDVLYLPSSYMNKFCLLLKTMQLAKVSKKLNAAPSTLNVEHLMELFMTLLTLVSRIKDKTANVEKHLSNSVASKNRNGLGLFSSILSAITFFELFTKERKEKDQQRGRSGTQMDLRCTIRSDSLSGII